MDLNVEVTGAAANKEGEAATNINKYLVQL